MRKPAGVIGLLFLIFFPANAKTARSRPTVEVVLPEYRYVRTVESLRAIDFRNFQFRVFDENRKSLVIARLRNGKYESRWTPQTGSDWVRLDWVKFVKPRSDYVVIGLSWVTTGASASDFGLVQVLGLKDKHPVVIQQIRFNTRGRGNLGARFSVANEALTIKGVHGWEHCCPGTLDVITYAWQGSGFEQRTAKSVPMPQER